jgi:small subunit ribosomal protein S20
MPHSSSAEKRLRQNLKRRAHNRAVKKGLKLQIKAVLAAAKTTSSLDELRKEYNLVAKKLDKAAAKRVIHPNLAARKKSQLAKLIQKKGAAGGTKAART